MRTRPKTTARTTAVVAAVAASLALTACSPEAPVATLGQALSLARTRSRRVYACAETFTEPLVWPAGVALKARRQGNGFVLDGRKQFDARLVGVEDDTVTIYAERVGEIALPFAQIATAKLLLFLFGLVVVNDFVKYLYQSVSR